MLTAKVKVATGIVKWWMNRNDFQGWVGFNDTIYILNEPTISAYSKEKFAKLMKHELTHLDDIKKLGIINFSIQYVWQYIWHGYENNYFEVKARTSETNPTFKSKYYELDSKYLDYIQNTV